VSPLLPVAILAGGRGTRLEPLTANVPKALVDVNGEPFIAHQLRLLRARGIMRVVVCAGHLGHMIQAYLGNSAKFGLGIEVCLDGSGLLGTAGALRAALPKLGPAFFVLYGDTYLACDYGAVQAAFERSGRLGLMTVFRNDDHWDRSNVEFANGRIVAYSKRERTTAMRHIDYGLGVLDARAIDPVPAHEPCDLETVYRDLLRREELAAYEVGERFYEIGTMQGLEETRRCLRPIEPSVEAAGS
jgi:MurNAc alpha-1-phosphate uridylyltransferase